MGVSRGRADQSFVNTNISVDGYRPADMAPQSHGPQLFISKRPHGTVRL